MENAIDIRPLLGDFEQLQRRIQCCRICFSWEPNEDLISPCMCKGTQQFIHRSCLDHWRSVKEGFAFTHCTTCKAQFHLRDLLFESNSWQKFRFRFFVARDILFVFLALQIVIAALGGITYLADINGGLRNFFGDNWGFSLYHPIAFYYCLGVLLFLALFGFFGLLSTCVPFLRNGDYGMPARWDADFSHDGCECGDGCACCDCCDCSLSPTVSEDCFILGIVILVIFAILGIVYGFFAGTIVLQRIWQRHQLILTKRELTKEFVVEDLLGRYTPPKLKREHEQRLKELHLL